LPPGADGLGVALLPASGVGWVPCAAAAGRASRAAASAQASVAEEGRAV